MSSPKIPETKPVQEIKQPDVATLTDKAKRSRSSAGITGGSLLTGPSGVASSAMSTGKSTLLGQ